MSDLRPRIEKLVGNLSWAEGPGRQAPARVPAPASLLRTGDRGFAEVVVLSMASRIDGVVRTISIAKVTVDGEVVEIRAGDPRLGRTGSEQTEGRTAYSAWQGRTT